MYSFLAILSFLTCPSRQCDKLQDFLCFSRKFHSFLEAMRSWWAFLWFFCSSNSPSTISNDLGAHYNLSHVLGEGPHPPWQRELHDLVCYWRHWRPAAHTTSPIKLSLGCICLLSCHIAESGTLPVPYKQVFPQKFLWSCSQPWKRQHRLSSLYLLLTAFKLKINK